MSDSSNLKDQVAVLEVSDDAASGHETKIKLTTAAEKRLDRSATFLAQFDDSLMPPLTPEEERKLVRKVDWYLLPMLLISCTLPAVDKSCLSTANLYGLATDNHLVGQQYSWLGSILFLGAMVGMYPNIFIVQKFNTGKVFAILSMIWSGLTLLLACCSSFAGLATIRFFMGWFESVITPIAVAMIQSFYVKREQPVRMTIIFAAITSTITGFLSWVVGQIHNDSLPLWKYLFLIVGSISFAWLIFLFFYLPESPIDAKFLSKNEKYYVVKRVAENQTGVVGFTWKWYQVFEAARDPKTWIIFFFNICCNIPNGGLSTFSAILFNNLGYSLVVSALLTMPTGIFSTLLAIIASYFAGRTKTYRSFIIMFSLILPLIGTGLMYGLPYSNLAGQMVGLYFLYGYYGPYLVGISLTQANTAGYTKRNVSFAWYYIGYSVGNIVGPQTFRSNQAPEYTGGTVAMLVCYVAAMALLGLYWFVATVQNRSREDLAFVAEAVNDEVDDALADKSDFEVRTFKYIK